MVDTLTKIGLGLVVFALVIGVGLVVLTEFADAVGTGTANTTIQYIMTQLGSSGLAGWIPAIIAILIGVLFIGYLSFGGRKY